MVHSVGSQPGGGGLNACVVIPPVWVELRLIKSDSRLCLMFIFRFRLVMAAFRNAARSAVEPSPRNRLRLSRPAGYRNRQPIRILR